MIQHANVIIQKTIALSSQLNGSLSPRRLLDPSFLFTALSDLIWRLWSWVETWLEIFSAKVHSFIQPWGISIRAFFLYGKIISCTFQFVHWKIFLLKDAAFFIVASSSRQNKIKRFFFFDTKVNKRERWSINTSNLYCQERFPKPIDHTDALE